MANIFLAGQLGKKEPRKYQFKYMTPKGFKSYEENHENVKIIGSTFLKTVLEPDDDMNDDAVYLQSKSEKNNESVYFAVTKPTRKFCKGYIHVGGNQFIAYKRRLWPILLLLLLALGLGVCLFLLKPNDSGKRPDMENSQAIDLSDDTKAVSKTYDFQTQGVYTISEDNPKIKVWNPETNTRVFSYSIYIDDNLIEETKGIAPGNMTEVDCSSVLSQKGEHDLTLSLSVLDENNGTVVGRADRKAVLTVN